MVVEGRAGDVERERKERKGGRLVVEGRTGHVEGERGREKRTREGGRAIRRMEGGRRKSDGHGESLVDTMPWPAACITTGSQASIFLVLVSLSLSAHLLFPPASAVLILHAAFYGYA